MITDIMYASIILHNMIVEDEGYTVSKWLDEENVEFPPMNHGPTNDFPNAYNG